MRTTYTIALLGVPADVHARIRQQLLEAGYDHAVDDRDGILDMTHIGLVVEPWRPDGPLPEADDAPAAAGGEG